MNKTRSKNSYHTIDSGIVKDALQSISKNQLIDSYIGGGMSLQFTIPTKLHRNTADIDFTSSTYNSYHDFKEHVTTDYSDMLDRGYELNFKKKRSTFDAFFTRGNEQLMIQLAKYSPNNYCKRKQILEREVEHKRTIDYNAGTLDLIAFEDLVAHKIIRSSTFIDYYNLKKPNSTSLEYLSDQIDNLTEQLNNGLYATDPEDASRLIAKYRLHSDFFDIKAVLLYHQTEFDESYYQEALESFDSSNGKTLMKRNKMFELISNS